MTQNEQIETDKLLHQELTESVIGVYYGVYTELGFGFLEKVYQNALVFALIEQGFKVEAQKKVDVYYKGRLVNDLVILELKAIELLLHEYELQLINYLRATEIEVGLLLNFGRKPQFKRKIYTNDKKKLVL